MTAIRGMRDRSIPIQKAERQPGFWQRVGLYWWLGMNESDPAAGWTGEHDADGRYLRAGE